MDINIYNSALISLLIQFIIGIISVFGLFLKLDNNDLILNQILLLETIVQFIEFIFYIWLVYNFSKIKINISLIRYLDWFITTPTMLFSIICFFIYKQYKSNIQTSTIPTISSVFFENFTTLLWIFAFNAIMLIFGFLGEIKIIKRSWATIIGFFSLISGFYLIYSNFVNNIKINQYVFWFNFLVWSLYGISYMFTFKNKNIFYNILDLFAKNINGLLILLYILYVKYSSML